MLRQRLLFGSLMILALAGLVFLDAWLSKGAVCISADSGLGIGARLSMAAKHGLPLTLLVALLAGAAGLELGRLTEAGGFRPFKGWAAAMCVTLALAPWVQIAFAGSGCCSGTAGGADLSAIGVILAIAFIGTCVGVLWRKTTAQALSTMGISMFIVFYIGVLAFFAIGIRYLWVGPAGAAALVYFILTVKCGDIGAFFTGSAIGRHKLVPWLSPGKTWEGGFGAVAWSMGMAELGAWIWGRWTGTLGPPPLSLSQALIFGLLMAVLGHVGDLVESAMKRDVGTKDSAHVVPAFGGLLDILDSPLFTAPVAWACFTLFRYSS